MPELHPEALAGHIDRLYRAAWALCGSPEDAEDLVQETFVRVLSKRRAIRGAELPYLLATLRNTFFDERRRAARRPQPAPELHSHELPDARGDGDPPHAMQTRELFEAVASLPLDFRLALVAVDIAGLSHREAAKLLATREATIATRLFRARGRVVEALESGQASGEGAAHPERLIGHRGR
ncbi:MAG: RNA polymerase sigma factor [Solirubrobacteraceae bacterium]